MKYFRHFEIKGIERERERERDRERKQKTEETNGIIACYVVVFRAVLSSKGCHTLSR